MVTSAPNYPAKYKIKIILKLKLIVFKCMIQIIISSKLINIHINWLEENQDVKKAWSLISLAPFKCQGLGYI